MRILLYLIIVLLSISSKIEAQKAELPLKNDMVFFTSGEVALGNTKKCLTNYRFFVDPTKLMAVSSSINKNSGNKRFYQSTPIQVIFQQSDFAPFKNNPACTDTVVGDFIMLLPGDMVPNYWNYFVKKKRIAVIQIKAKWSLIYLSKSSYKINFKGFSFQTTSMEPTGPVYEEFSLDKTYMDYLKLEKPEKFETVMYQDLTFAVQECQKLVKEVLESSYKVDELD